MSSTVSQHRFFFFNDTATTEIYTLSLHDALPISRTSSPSTPAGSSCTTTPGASSWAHRRWRPSTRSSGDRKSTRLNSSHSQISYAVFCLKKKNKHCLSSEARCQELPCPQRITHYT